LVVYRALLRVLVALLGVYLPGSFGCVYRVPFRIHNVVSNDTSFCPSLLGTQGFLAVYTSLLGTQGFLAVYTSLLGTQGFLAVYTSLLDFEALLSVCRALLGVQGSFGRMQGSFGCT